MEYAIAVFVGIWISAAGILAYCRIDRDFSDVTEKNGKERQH